MQELIERYKNSSCQLEPGPAAARHVASQQRPPSSSPTPTPKPIEASAAASNIPQMSNGNPNYINYAHPPPNDTTTQSGLFQYY
ncbi:hypothetical protein SAY86_000112 [Trapa natans]|uniref:Uncharacterized protein n=1 Tax=Trapa natans TaxID=22666 RepID=A0AAN7MAB1_TRANT|nr:hypothetical protein SAY86_000112 [Trapa natans]